MRNLNIIGPQVRRLRSQRGWSQNYFAIKLELLGMEHATRKKVAKIEAREVWVSDDDMLFISRVFRVDLNELFPPKILGASHLYHAICAAKASPYGCLIFALLFCPELGAGAFHFASIVVGV
ncbi:hypothetical protein BH09VER1_BH09VER1_12520 [soil metagenome]